MKMTLSRLMLLVAAVIGVLASFGSASSHLPVFRSGFFNKYRIPKGDFPKGGAINSEVSFNFSTEYGFPELPSWLHLEQRRAKAPAFLYGAPSYYDDSTIVEIIGWNKRSYSAYLEYKSLAIINRNGFPWFQAEFFIMNKTLDQFLLDGDERKILKIVKDHYWSPVDLNITMVETAVGRGGRIPLPDSHKYEGVIVRVGSSRMWGENETLQNKQQPKGRDYFRDAGFEVMWKKFSWKNLHLVKALEPQRQALLPEDRIIPAVSYNPREFDDSPRDFDIDFILIVVIPIIIILIFVLLLSIIMCFGREGRRKRDQETPQIKLTHHHNIQRSTLRLRELSKPREPEQSPQSSTSQGPHRPRQSHGEYERLRQDDEDRNDGRNAPPPYRMPPGAAGKGEPQQV